MGKNTMREAIHAAIIEDGKLLLLRKRAAWILPGGKLKEGESELECLTREVKEELSGTEIEVLGYYSNFLGKSPHKGDTVHSKVYLAEIRGKLKGPSKEINKYEWVDPANRPELTSISLQVIKSLYEKGYLTDKKTPLPRYKKKVDLNSKLKRKEGRFLSYLDDYKTRDMITGPENKTEKSTSLRKDKEGSFKYPKE